MSPAPPPPSIPGSKGDADTFFPVQTGAATESNAPLESAQKKMVLRRHAEYILHLGGVDCGIFRQSGGPGGPTVARTCTHAPLPGRRRQPGRVEWVAHGREPPIRGSNRRHVSDIHCRANGWHTAVGHTFGWLTTFSTRG